jgi:hypothetical protein
VSATLKNVTALVDELKNLSSGEIQVIISNPTDRPGGERVTITAYGEQYDTRNLANASALLELWKAELVVAGIKAIAAALLPKAYRATLWRLGDGEWAIRTQTLGGVPQMGGWTITDSRVSAVTVATEAADQIVGRDGYHRAFGWVSMPEQSNMLVTILLKD